MRYLLITIIAIILFGITQAKTPPTRIPAMSYAKINGYFWLPCPICGEYFGGHEKHGDVNIITSHGDGWVKSIGVCKKTSCSIQAVQRNFIYWKKFDYIDRWFKEGEG